MTTPATGTTGPRPPAWLGRWLMAAATLHVVSAVAQYHPLLGRIVKRGVFDTVVGQPEIGALVWSLLFGAVAFIGGMAVHALERAGVSPPRALGGALLALAVVGVVLVPVSGFWLVFVPALAMLRRRPGA